MNKSFILWKSCGNPVQNPWKSPRKTRVKNVYKNSLFYSVRGNHPLSHQLSHFFTITFPQSPFPIPPQSFPLFHRHYYYNY